MFTWEICEIFRNNFFYRTRPLAASELFENHPKLEWHWVFYFLSIWVFFHEHSRITGLQRKGKGIFRAGFFDQRRNIPPPIPPPQYPPSPIRQAIHFNNTRMLISALFKDIFQQNFKIRKSVFMKYVIVTWQCYSIAKASYFILM